MGLTFEFGDVHLQSTHCISLLPCQIPNNVIRSVLLMGWFLPVAATFILFMALQCFVYVYLSFSRITPIERSQSRPRCIWSGFGINWKWNNSGIENVLKFFNLSKNFNLGSNPATRSILGIPPRATSVKVIHSYLERSQHLNSKIDLRDCLPTKGEIFNSLLYIKHYNLIW